MIKFQKSPVRINLNWKKKSPKSENSPKSKQKTLKLKNLQLKKIGKFSRIKCWRFVFFFTSCKFLNCLRTFEFFYVIAFLLKFSLKTIKSVIIWKILWYILLRLPSHIRWHLSKHWTKNSHIQLQTIWENFQKSRKLCKLLHLPSKDFL